MPFLLRKTTSALGPELLQQQLQQLQLLLHLVFLSIVHFNTFLLLSLLMLKFNAVTLLLLHKLLLLQLLQQHITMRLQQFLSKKQLMGCTRDFPLQ